ncbi:hypothetical protein [Micromonospora profundi]|uniref:hypothetical protein n=1 Tax=Micromonospora profundi TaxID=1420889 RepID=UPI00366513A3
MIPNFEVFHRPKSTPDDTPTVTISPAAMTLNKAALELLGHPERVELLYDRGQHLMGIRPAGDGDRQSSFKATPTPQGGAKVAHRSFVNHYGIPAGPARRWPAFLDGGVLCVDLKGGSTLIARNGTAAVSA